MKYIQKIFLICLMLWIALAAFRTIYNISKIIFEEKHWIVLSDDDKRKELYGDGYIMYQEVKKHISPQTNLLLISSDTKQYFLGRYLLYPTHVYWTGLAKSNYHDWQKTYQYLLIYHPSTMSFTEYKKYLGNKSLKKILNIQNIATLYKVI